MPGPAPLKLKGDTSAYGIQKDRVQERPVDPSRHHRRRRGRCRRGRVVAVVVVVVGVVCLYRSQRVSTMRQVERSAVAPLAVR